jgi:hypothetical protein
MQYILRAQEMLLKPTNPPRRTVMKTLMIEDLNVAEELDSKAMTSVRGGTFLYPLFPSYDVDKTSVSASVEQLISQTQSTKSNIGNNLAFVTSPITATIQPSQWASNSSSVSGH